MDKPFSQACENNKAAIFALLKHYLKNSETVLEIGSGTGQHARFFADNLPNISWQTSDLKENHPGINAWIENSAHNNILGPLIVDVSDTHSWPDSSFDAIYTANTLHIMSWHDVIDLFNLVATHLKENKFFFCYGPFNRNGQLYSSDSTVQLVKN